ncbi:MAG: hypothetical protein ACM3PF_15000 [Bacteroidota bacterium]
MLYGALAATFLLLPSISTGQDAASRATLTRPQTQAGPWTASGTRVRLTPRSGPRVTGTFRSATAETLYLETQKDASGTRGIAWSSLKSAEWAPPSRHLAGIWGRLGLLAGLGGGLVAVHGGRSEFGVGGFFNDEDDFVRVAAFSVGGLLVGEVLGALAGSGRWSPLPTPLAEPEAPEPAAPGTADRVTTEVRQVAP